MINEPITLDLKNSSIDHFSQKIDSFLQSNGVSSKDIAMQRLLVEDTLIKYQKHFGQNTSTRLEFKITKHGCAFSLHIKAEEHDLLIADEADELSLLSNFIEQTENNLVYSYRNGENILKCAFHHDKRYTLVKLLKSIGIPMALWILLHALTGSIDALMLGAISQEYLSAVALCSKLTEIFHEVASVIISSSASLVVVFWGRKDKRMVEQVFGYATRLLVCLGIIFTLITALFPSQILGILTNDARLLYVGTSYLRLNSPVFLLTGIVDSVLVILRCCGRAKKMVEHSLILFITKVILNYVFIHGIGGFEGLGVSGAALVSVIIATAEAIIIIGELTEEGWIKFRLKYFLSVSEKIHNAFWKHLLWMGIEVVGLTVISLASSSIIGHSGNLDLITGFSLATSIAAFASFAYKSLHETASIIMGYEHGRKHLNKIKVYGKALVRYSCVIGLLTALIYLCIAFPVAKLHSHFSHTALVCYVSISALYAINMFSNSVAITIQHCLFSMSGKYKTAYLTSTIIALISSVVPAMALSYIKNITNITILIPLICYPLVLCIIYYILYKQYKWVKI